jgi:hypothetical protein
MIEPSGRDVAAISEKGTAVVQAIEAARLRVVRRDQQLGVPLVTWDGVQTGATWMGTA